LRSYLCGVDEARWAVVELRFLGVAGLGLGVGRRDALSASANLIGTVKKSRKDGLPTVTPGAPPFVTEITLGPRLALKVRKRGLHPPTTGEVQSR